LGQAERMEQFSGVRLTDQQKELYIILRDEQSKGGMCDQRLLAEIIGLTDETSLKTFKKSYPNIFDIA